MLTALPLIVGLAMALLIPRLLREPLRSSPGSLILFGARGTARRRIEDLDALHDQGGDSDGPHCHCRRLLPLSDRCSLIWWLVLE